MMHVKYLRENQQIEAAREIIATAKQNCTTAKSYVASMKLEYQAGALGRAYQDA